MDSQHNLIDNEFTDNVYRFQCFNYIFIVNIILSTQAFIFVHSGLESHIILYKMNTIRRDIYSLK